SVRASRPPRRGAPAIVHPAPSPSPTAGEPRATTAGPPRALPRLRGRGRAARAGRKARAGADGAGGAELVAPAPRKAAGGQPRHPERARFRGNLLGMLLAFDLDKTLVTDDFRLPDDIADAIGAARAAGHHVTVLTGRPLVAAREYLERLAVDRHHSVHQGSTILAAGGTPAGRQRLQAE